MQEQIFDMLLNEEEVSWKTILYDLVKTEQMDPWNINITLLTKKYILTIKDFKDHNLRISGKIVLAAAFLLRIKSSHLVDNDITKLDQLLNSGEEELEEDLYDELSMNSNKYRGNSQSPPLIPRNPQPRNRKVSIHDLVEALQRAMVSKRRGLQKLRPTKFVMPTKGVDIMEVIRDVYSKVVYYTNKYKNEKLTFSKLLPPQAGREAKVFTFLPLLHLENQKKLLMAQEEPFKEIYINLTSNKKIKQPF